METESPLNKDKFTPSYLMLTQDELEKRAKKTFELIKGCTLCPRSCEVDRTSGETGYCGITEMPFISSYGPHFGEELALVGHGGSGTIFMGGCNLGCVFCQNWNISHMKEGYYTDEKALAGLMISLQKQGCHNINFVTPTHQTHSIIGSLKIATEMGLALPIVYNCGGYESTDTLRLLDGIVDIYMPDLKYMDPETASRLSDAPEYTRVACKALKEMHRQVGDLVTDSEGIAQRGMIIRHLVLPGGLSGTKEAMRFIADELSTNSYVNIMGQYHPCHEAKKYPEINRRPTHEEMREAFQLAKEAGLHRLD